LGINTSVPAVAGVPTPGATIKSAGTLGNGIEYVIAGNSGTGNALSLAADTHDPVGFTDGSTGDVPPIGSAPSGESLGSDTALVAFDSLGNKLQINVNAVLESKTATGTTWRYYASSPDNVGGNTALGTGLITFDNNGQLLKQAGNVVNIDRTGTGATSPQPITLDFSSLTALTDKSTDFKVNSQDGKDIGTWQALILIPTVRWSVFSPIA